MPELEIKELREQDHKKAIKAAIKGMHFDWCMKNRLLLNLYGRYFWYQELTKATSILAAYYGEEFAGILLCAIKGKKPQYHAPMKAAYAKVFDFLQKIFVKKGAGVYEKTTEELYNEYIKYFIPDGEITFLAANTDLPIKGIGSFLLAELEKREKGKEIFLYTDNACNYQFYEHREFKRAEEKEITLEIGHRKIDLSCYLYHRKL